MRSTSSSRNQISAPPYFFLVSISQTGRMPRCSAIYFIYDIRKSNPESLDSTSTYHLFPENGPSLSSTPLQRMLDLSIPNYSTSEPQSQTTIPFIPGGGLTRRMLTSIPSSWNTPTASLLQFVLEGDNRVDAELFATVVAKVIGMDVEEWKQPCSWKHGLFGTPLDQTVYG